MESTAVMAGKSVVVTGASSGIGLEASVQLASMGARVMMVARDPERGAAALAAVERRTGSKAVSLALCDLASLAQVRALAADLLGHCPQIDVLINNAGTVHARREVTPEGFERTLAVNHLGPFLLTNLLLKRLIASAPSRIVNVASVAHRRATLDFDNLHFERGGYGIMAAYGRSKLANVLFTMELARRLAGTGVTANCVHPGGVATNIWSRAPLLARPLLWIGQRFMLSAAEGAGRVVRLATDPALEGQTGGYYTDNSRAAPSAQAEDAALARRLWEVSAELVGLAEHDAPRGATPGSVIGPAGDKPTPGATTTG